MDKQRISAVKIEARLGGRLIANVSVPTPDPARLFKFVGLSMGALQAATNRKHVVVMCVCPPWKVWILQHVLRCTK